MITGDFETRSACNLPKAGAWAYSKHPTTEVMCFCWNFPEDDEVHAWWPAYPELGIDQAPFPTELARRIAAGEILEAHNAFFEWCIWNHVWRLMLPDLPELPLSQIRCSAAKAAAFALPRALDKAIKALGLPVDKDMEGNALMRRISKPRKITAAEKKRLRAEGYDPETVVFWPHMTADTIWRLIEYCQQDIRAEKCLSHVLRPLNPREQLMWEMDLRMNARGIACDMALVHTAIRLAEAEIERQNAELAELTGGYVEKASGRVKFKEWMHAQGVPLPNTQAATLDMILGYEPEDDPGDEDEESGDTILDIADLDFSGVTLTPVTRRALEIVRDINRSSIAKYKQMLIQVSDGNRLRDMMLYCGASRTGRWAGKGVQPHNFIRGYSEGMEAACADILRGDPEALRLLYNGSVMEVLSKATRGALVAGPGKRLMVADFAAIEARVLLWLANAMSALEVFYRGEDIYLDMATSIFGYPCTNKHDFPFERKVGKASILGLGYQMGDEKFEDTCRKDGIINPDPQFFKKIVKVYRKEKYPEVESFWYEMERAAIKAVRSYDPKVSPKGEVIECRRIKWFMWGQFLHMELPSGRLLSYFRPIIVTRWSYSFAAINERGHECRVMVSVKAGTGPIAARRLAERTAKIAKKRLVPNAEPKLYESETLTFMHENSKTRAWERKETYGGELVENATQATARDLMAEAMLRADQSEIYDVLLSVHDELVSEVDEDKGDVKEFEDLLAELPPWAEGCPVAAEGWAGIRYRK